MILNIDEVFKRAADITKIEDNWNGQDQDSIKRSRKREKELIQTKKT